MSKKKIAVLMEAYNEESNLKTLLPLIDKQYDKYVIDDASTDKTAMVAENNMANVVSQCINLGQGYSFITGMKLLLEKDYDFIVHMDADSQHNPVEIPKFIEKFEETDADIVQGSRVLGSDYKTAHWVRKMFLPPLTWLINKLTGYNLSDAMCGFRVLRVKSLRKAGYIFDDMTEAEYLASEMWIKFSQAGLTVTEVPITLEGRKHGFSYKGLFKYGWGVVTTIIRTKLDIYKNRIKTGEARNEY